MGGAVPEYEIGCSCRPVESSLPFDKANEEAIVRMGPQYGVWIDVEDIFQYFENNSRPSGIQRLVFEILRVIRARAAVRAEPMDIRLVRRTATSSGSEVMVAAPFTPVSFEELEAVFGSLAPKSESDEPIAPVDPRPLAPTPPSMPPGMVQRVRTMLVRRLEAVPPEIGTPLLSIAVNQLQVVRLARSGLRSRLNRRRATVPPRSVAPPPSETPAERVPPRETASMPDGNGPQPGDVFLVLGAAWSERGFGERLAVLRREFGVVPVLLVYDLIPALKPEWCARSLITDFRHWLDSTLPQCGRLLAISRSTAESVEAYARTNRLQLVAPVRPIPIGSGFGERRSVTSDLRSRRPSGLPLSGSYVLFISTVEARKNHMLAFLVWQRLLAECPLAEVPTLVFAGREGWLVADLMQQIENTDWLRGKLRFLRDPSDDELVHLYDGCLFTLFPSLFEGWGLPVTESLINGVPCVASNATSIPEAGGSLCRYFDPESVDDAYRVVRDTLADREDLARWRQDVRDRFVPVSWQDTADAVLDACDEARAGEGARSRMDAGAVP